MKYTVLSLFDGISCGFQALKELGIEVETYYASEIDKYAIDVALKNHPEIVELGDVTKWKDWDIDWSSIDLVIGGSPCQGFTFSGKRLNFADERSKLILDYFDILECAKAHNPNVKFLLENVKMESRCKEVIDKRLGVIGKHIDSEDFSAQRRDRIYWTNIPFDENYLRTNEACINDIADPAADKNEKLYLTEKHLTAFYKSYNWKHCRRDRKSMPLLASYYKQPPHCPYIPHGQNFRNYDCKKYSMYRRLSPLECERLQTLPDNYTASGASGAKISDTQRYKMCGNGWTVSVIKHIFKSL